MTLNEFELQILDAAESLLNAAVLVSDESEPVDREKFGDVIGDKVFVVYTTLPTHPRTIYTLMQARGRNPIIHIQWDDKSSDEFEVSPSCGHRLYQMLREVARNMDKPKRNETEISRILAQCVEFERRYAVETYIHMDGRNRTLPKVEDMESVQYTLLTPFETALYNRVKRLADDEDVR